MKQKKRYHVRLSHNGQTETLFSSFTEYQARVDLDKIPVAKYPGSKAWIELGGKVIARLNGPQLARGARQ